MTTSQEGGSTTEKAKVRKQLKQLAQLTSVLLASLIVLVLISKRDQSESSEPIFPGLKPVDVYLNLTNKGFRLKKDFSEPQHPIWRCIEETSKHQMMVEVFGKGATEVTLVRGTFHNYSTENADRAAKEFLGYIASIPYDGSLPEKARSWVLTNIGSSTKTEIAGVSFEIITNPATPRCRMLILQPAIAGQQ